MVFQLILLLITSLKPFSIPGISKKILQVYSCEITMVFDCVNHELLYPKLKFYGLRDAILEWLKSYLNNRKQRVDLEIIKTYCYSLGWETVQCGVPQGSVLGSLLFNIYMNDIPKIIKKLSHTILIADDTSILVTSTDNIELNQKLHPILQHISKWFETNQLVLNTDKAYI